jgi:DNA-directed RNA polymerase specialized sigma24 family protein
LRVARREWYVLGLKNHAEPEDLCQSAFRELIARPPKQEFRSAADLPAYVKEMIKNQAKMHRRGEATQRRANGRTNPSPIEHHDVVDDNADPAQLAYISELRSFKRAHMRDDEWHIFELRAAGYEWPKIAAQVGGQADVLRIQHERRKARIRRWLLMNV